VISWRIAHPAASTTEAFAARRRQNSKRSTASTARPDEPPGRAADLALIWTSARNVSPQPDTPEKRPLNLDP
jgi:hypothetical protein